MTRLISRLTGKIRFLSRLIRIKVKQTTEIICESPSYYILKKSRNFHVISLTKKTFDLADYYNLYRYNSNDEYQEKQKAKTKRRLIHAKASQESVLWTSKENIAQLARLIQANFMDREILGMCMGSRSGEEQVIFQNALGPNSNVIGVEIEDSARDLPNTLVCDFHKLPSTFNETQDFVYSNSHDQSNDPKAAFFGWIRALKPGGLLILEHSRSHGKLHQGWQDPFGIESEFVPFVILTWFPDQLHLESILYPQRQYDQFHYLFIFRKVQ